MYICVCFDFYTHLVKIYYINKLPNRRRMFLIAAPTLVFSRRREILVPIENVGILVICLQQYQCWLVLKMV